MGETILVVDDDREITGAIAAALEREGYQVLRAYNGMEALDQLFMQNKMPLALDPLRPNYCPDFTEILDGPDTQ